MLSNLSSSRYLINGNGPNIFMYLINLFLLEQLNCTVTMINVQGADLNVVVSLPKPQYTRAVTGLWDLQIAPSHRRILSACNQPEPRCSHVKLNSKENKQLLR